MVVFINSYDQLIAWVGGRIVVVFCVGLVLRVCPSSVADRVPLEVIHQSFTVFCVCALLHNVILKPLIICLLGYLIFVAIDTTCIPLTPLWREVGLVNRKGHSLVPPYTHNNAGSPHSYAHSSAESPHSHPQHCGVTMLIHPRQCGVPHSYTHSVAGSLTTLICQRQLALFSLANLWGHKTCMLTTLAQPTSRLHHVDGPYTHPWLIVQGHTLGGVYVSA